VVVSPPGVHTNFSPSISTDSLYPQPSPFVPEKSAFKFFFQRTAPLEVSQENKLPNGVITYTRSPSTVGVLREPCQEVSPEFQGEPVFVIQICLPDLRSRQIRYSSVSPAVVDNPSPNV